MIFFQKSAGSEERIVMSDEEREMLEGLDMVMNEVERSNALRQNFLTPERFVIDLYLAEQIILWSL